MHTCQSSCNFKDLAWILSWCISVEQTPGSVTRECEHRARVLWYLPPLRYRMFPLLIIQPQSSALRIGAISRGSSAHLNFISLFRGEGSLTFKPRALLRILPQLEAHVKHLIADNIATDMTRMSLDFLVANRQAESRWDVRLWGKA